MGTFRNETILENEFTCIASPHTKFVKFLICWKAFEALFDNESRDTLGAFSWLRLCVCNESRSNRTVRNPMPNSVTIHDDTKKKVGENPPELVAIKSVSTLNLSSWEFHANNIASTTRFTHSETPNLFSWDQVRKVFLLLRICSPSEYLSEISE